MKTRTKVIVDGWLGRCSVFLLNIAARILGSILSIDHTLQKAPQRIVVCKFLGMGSIIQSTPLLLTLRKNFPSAEIIFVTSKSNRALAESIECVSRVMTVDDSSFMKTILSTFSAIINFWKNRPDLYIDLETYSYFSTALATMSCARDRFGFYRVERNIRLGVYTHMMFFNARAPISQSYLQMARLAGCKSVIEDLYHFPVTTEVKSATHEKLKKLSHGISEYIIINPNASDLRIERRWPAENFRELIGAIKKDFPLMSILITGSADEFNYAESVFRNIPDKEYVFNTAGMFSLKELFALTAGCSMMITNDTGPMHISFSAQRPTIALFGPASPSQYGQNRNAFGIYKNIYCSPCVHDFLTPPCCGDNQCMKKITVAEVSALAGEVLRSALTPGTVITAGMSFLKKDGETSLGIVTR